MSLMTFPGCLFVVMHDIRVSKGNQREPNGDQADLRVPEFLEAPMWLWVKTNQIPLWGKCATHFRTYFSGDWDVHWGYDLDFDPWPFGCVLK